MPALSRLDKNPNSYADAIRVGSAGSAALTGDSPWTNNQGGWSVHDGLELDQRN